jgi:hypothetical protein
LPRNGSILKAQQWEKCKGELLAFLALSGSKMKQYDGNAPLKCEWEIISEKIYAFIISIEDDALHE